MIINHNISSLNTLNKLNKNNKNTASSMEKLASGLRINKASDDSAGLAISEKMRAQIRGLQQAERNIQDGISLIQTAEGGLSEIQDPNLLRLRELAIQSANDTLTNEDRQQIQEEVQQIKEGINEIANNTKFNENNLLNTEGTTITTTTTTTVTNLVPQTVSILSTGAVYYTEFLQNPTGTEVFGLGYFPQTTGDGRIVFTFTNPPSNPDDIYTPIGADLKETLNNIKNTFESIKLGSSGTSAQQNTILSKNMKLQIYENHLVLIADANMASTIGGGAGGTNNGGHFFGTGTTAHINYNSEVTTTITNTTTTTTPESIILQIGANSGESYSLQLTDARINALGIDNIDLSTRQGAESAISKIDKAIEKVSSERGKFASYQNRLEHALNNASNYEINLTASESRIRDVDMAKEMMELTKNQILSQASQAMLAQTNQQPQNVLQLLK
ncbi:hypothetical protein BSK48_25210 [Paenibacillus odorifer]|uniref:flagellin N-terminal helical domain-containing protein n=2 Tax=Paenibacillus TaxID=44249 RepID=UPI00096F3FA7|nr:flagellin [Paenibacillus odorifer]OMD64102.1 hypothetical protein BSK48_25210 [Paenibacillus odorifer]